MHNVLFSGVIIDLVVKSGVPVLIVLYSDNKNIQKGSEITKINKEKAIDFVLRNSNKYMKKTGSLYSRMKSMTMYMSLYNPFDPVLCLKAKGSPRVSLIYKRAFKGLFPEH